MLQQGEHSHSKGMKTQGSLVSTLIYLLLFDFIFFLFNMFLFLSVVYVKHLKGAIQISLSLLLSLIIVVRVHISAKAQQFSYKTTFKFTKYTKIRSMNNSLRNKGNCWKQTDGDPPSGPDPHQNVMRGFLGTKCYGNMEIKLYPPCNYDYYFPLLSTIPLNPSDWTSLWIIKLKALTQRAAPLKQWCKHGDASHEVLGLLMLNICCWSNAEATVGTVYVLFVFGSEDLHPPSSWELL